MEGEEFLRRMASGDARVFDDLYPIMRKIALGACRDLRIFDQSRDDIVQDVCMKVFTHWRSYQGDSKLNTWIYSIARNRCLDDLRRLQVRKAVMTEPVAANEDDSTQEEPRAPADLVHKSRFNLEQRLCVQQVLDELDRLRSPAAWLTFTCRDEHTTCGGQAFADAITWFKANGYVRK